MRSPPPTPTDPTTSVAPTTAPPPPAVTAKPAATRPLAGRVVAIDPGHNGANGATAANVAAINALVPAGPFRKACDTTGTETDGGYPESSYNFDVATRMVPLLQAVGITVILTRNSNSGVGPCIDQRAAIGNSARADAAVSIHADGGPAGGRGFDIIQPALVPGFTNGIVAPSHEEALDVRARFLAVTGMPYSSYTGVDGLDTRSDLGGLNLSTVPKVLIECGNMRNATDAALLVDPGFRQKAAEGLALGIEDFLASRPAVVR